MQLKSDIYLIFYPENDTSKCIKLYEYYGIYIYIKHK